MEHSDHGRYVNNPERTTVSHATTITTIRPADPIHTGHYAITCECGWTGPGPRLASQVGAEAAGDNHRSYEANRLARLNLLVG